MVACLCRISLQGFAEEGTVLETDKYRDILSKGVGMCWEIIFVCPFGWNEEEEGRSRGV